MSISEAAAPSPKHVSDLSQGRSHSFQLQHCRPTLCQLEIALTSLTITRMFVAGFKWETGAETWLSAFTSRHSEPHVRAPVDDILVATSGMHHHYRSIARCAQLVAFH